MNGMNTPHAFSELRVQGKTNFKLPPVDTEVHPALGGQRQEDQDFNIIQFEASLSSTRPCLKTATTKSQIFQKCSELFQRKLMQGSHQGIAIALNNNRLIYSSIVLININLNSHFNYFVSEESILKSEFYTYINKLNSPIIFLNRKWARQYLYLFYVTVQCHN